MRKKIIKMRAEIYDYKNRIEKIEETKMIF